MALDTTYHEHHMRSQRFYAYGFNAGQNEEFATAADAWEALVREEKDATIPRDFNGLRTTWDQQDAIIGFGAGFTAGKLAPVVEKLDSGYKPITCLMMGATSADALNADDEQWVEVDIVPYLKHMRLTYFTDKLPPTTTEDTLAVDTAATMIADSAFAVWPELEDRFVGRYIFVRLDKNRKEDETLWPIY